jgi:hypothetical protein
MPVPAVSNSWGRNPTVRLGTAQTAALEEIVNEFARGVIHLHVERFYAAGQIVEHHDGRDGDEQADSGGHERFRNAARNGR